MRRPRRGYPDPNHGRRRLATPFKNSYPFQTRSDILFVGDVGEEGPGDLRGMRYLFQKGPYKDKIKFFLAVDGPGDASDLVTGAVASRRYRVALRGPGGHSFGSSVS
jgi:tripeptide aminopeptidase